ncbi:hypothetical protein [Streptomyces sp. NPDC058086]|uniref:hypothetical protein n=1 Tax=Streptomyces sp. NPDC058086 TaxID=3346334 RepID=UPI0036E49F32
MAPTTAAGSLQATDVLADELLQAFGYPETGLITHDGQFHPDKFGPRIAAALTQWAHQHGLT